MKAAVTAVAVCCLALAGIAGALIGWSFGSRIGMVALAGSTFALGFAAYRGRNRYVAEPSRRGSKINGLAQ